MINLKPYKAVMDEILPGDTLRVSHTDCSAGEDTRRRLYLTRVYSDPTKVIAYCHNCCESALSTGKNWEAYRNEKHGDGSVIPDKTTKVAKVWPPNGMIGDIRQWDTPSMVWAINNKLTQDMITTYGIKLDPSSGRVYLPRWQIQGFPKSTTVTLQGYQLRLVHGEGSKYLTVTGEHDVGYTVLSHNNRQPSPNGTDVVVVEDLVSGIHIAETHANGDPVDVLVNYGVKINPLLVAKAATYDNIAIWLDNDSDHVIQQAKHYARTIDLYRKQPHVTKVVTQESDPKHYSHDDIYVTLDTIWTT